MKNKFVVVIFLASIMGCTTPRVKYSPVSGEVDASNADEVGVLFRIPRSIIKIVKDSAIPLAGFTSTAIDPIQTLNKTWLPLNENKFAYTLSITSGNAGTIKSEKFASIDTELPSFPFASCDIATLKIYAPSGTQFPGKVSTVPTEFDYPASSNAEPILSTLYRAKPIDDILSTTILKVSYIDDTFIPKTVATETQDNVKEEIKTAASIIGTLVSAAAAAPGTPINLEETTEIANFSFPVANNKNYILAPLPEKGSITMHTTCGADVTDTSQIKSSVGASLDVLQTAVQEGLTLYKNAKASGKSASK